MLVLLPGQNMPQLGNALISIDKAIHAFLFMVLGFLMVVGFTKQSTYSGLRNKALNYAFIVTAIYAVSIEVVQLFSKDRAFELEDMLANLAGCFIGFSLFFAIYK